MVIFVNSRGRFADYTEHSPLNIVVYVFPRQHAQIVWNRPAITMFMHHGLNNMSVFLSTMNNLNLIHTLCQVAVYMEPQPVTVRLVYTFADSQ